MAKTIEKKLEIASEFVKCPKCVKDIKPQGMPGHMRFVHATHTPSPRKDAPPPKPIQRVVASVSVVQELKSIVADLDEVRQELERVKKKKDAEWFKHDETLDDRLSVLRAEETKLKARLQQLKARTTPNT